MRWPLGYAMSGDNIHVLPGGSTGEPRPNDKIVPILEELLARAKAGDIACFAATSVTPTGIVGQHVAIEDHRMFAVLGALTCLEQEIRDVILATRIE